MPSEVRRGVPDPSDDAAGSGGIAARERFLHLDGYRVRREWLRYEGTAQRNLFRQLRVRFLLKHACSGGCAVDVGSGPGRFAPFLGTPGTRRVLVDLSMGMLRSARVRALPPSGEPPLDLVVGDGLHPPFRSGTFHEVVALGNPLGFSGREASEFLERLTDLVAPGGTVVIETMAGPGERSRYLTRLPGGAVRRLLHAPLPLVAKRVVREGFEIERDRDPSRRGFRRMGADEIENALRARGIDVTDRVAVASALGPDADRLEAVAEDPIAWGRLLELEERLGRAPARWPRAAALLVAGTRRAGGREPPSPHI